MGQIFCRSRDKEKRRKLRNALTPAEVMLWARIKGGQLNRLMFRRQYSIGRYVVDFYLPQYKLAIEIDGSSHQGPEVVEYDKNRQAFLEDLGVHFLRFTNNDVYQKIDWVLNEIVNRVISGVKK